MKLTRCVAALAMTGAIALPSAWAADQQEHSHDHPADAPVIPQPTGADQQMKAMRDMHRKLQAAKTSEDRAALMKDHMKVMQDGMAMMARMKEGAASGRKGPASDLRDHEAMVRRMDMMEMMMQMMMDRQAGTVPPTK